jgi:hypothetical protein
MERADPHEPDGRTVVSTHPVGHPGMPLSDAIRLIAAVLILGSVSILAASVDPWLLVVLAGLGLTTYAVFDRTADGWILAV